MNRRALARYLRRLAISALPILWVPGCANSPSPADAAVAMDFAQADRAEPLDQTVLPDLNDPCGMVPLDGSSGCVWFAFVDAGIGWDARFTWVWSPDGGPDAGEADMAGQNADPCAPCRFHVRDDLYCGQCVFQRTGCGPTYLCSADDCSNQCLGSGRRPAGLVVPSVPAGEGLGAWLAAAAHLEAASVPAFARLERELARHGAPERLLAGARRARVDEERHARILGDLALGRGARVPRLEVEPVALRPLDEVAIENAVEGCVRERLGALTLARQARRTADPALASLLAGIASDEARHGRLSLAVDAWAHARLSPAARRRVASARRAEHQAVLAGQAA